MKIVYVNPFFTEGMGYIENCLPKAMAKRGHEVHLICTTGKVYFYEPFYKETYEPFFGPPFEKAGTYQVSGGVVLHRLNFIKILNTYYFRGLKKVLKDIKPDIVHMWDVTNPHTVQFFYLSKELDYIVYTGNHYLLSVLKVHKEWHKLFSILKYKWLFLKVIPGRLLHRYYKRCYAATADAHFVAEKYMGVPREKIVVTPLGVDTDIFKPAPDQSKSREFRSSLGFATTDFIVLYTGRFAIDKNPLLLAQAIDTLQKKGYKDIKGLFVGSGDQKAEIQACEACKIVDFIPFYELYKYYQIADIAVWPTQESTSMLDAAATGIPVIVNDTVQATERYEGNGLTYKLGDKNDLEAQILKLYLDPKLRTRLAQEGERRMRMEFSWDKIAKEREADYLADLKERRYHN